MTDLPWIEPKELRTLNRQLSTALSTLKDLDRGCYDPNLVEAIHHLSRAMDAVCSAEILRTDYPHESDVHDDESA